MCSLNWIAAAALSKIKPIFFLASLVQPYLPSCISHFPHEHFNTCAESEHLLLHPTQCTGLTETLKLQLSKPVPCAIAHKGAHTCEALCIGTIVSEREQLLFPMLPDQIMFKEKERRKNEKRRQLKS